VRGVALAEKEGRIGSIVLPIISLMACIIAVFGLNDTLNDSLSKDTFLSETSLNDGLETVGNDTLETFFENDDQTFAAETEQELNESLLPGSDSQSFNNNESEEIILPEDNETAIISNETEINITPRLAAMVGGKTTDTPYIRDYLEVYRNFSEINYDKLAFNSTLQVKMTIGAKEDNIKGFEAGEKLYAAHLIICNHNERTCSFRLNGIATGPISAANDINAKSPSKISLYENTTLQVEEVIWDYCDGRRFCNMYYEAYDIVNVTVVRR
jgi:hypothetical protein